MTIDLIEVITEAANRQDTQDAVDDRFYGDNLFDDEELVSQFCDGSYWKQLSCDEPLDRWSNYLLSWDSKVPNFFIDMCGDSDSELVKELAKDPEKAKKCLLHTFIAPGVLSDEIRIEIVTTADREKLVGWTLIGD